MKYFVLLFYIPFLLIACGQSDGLDSDISRACSNDRFAPTPDSECPVEDFISIGARGSTCLCQSEFGDKFLLSIGPDPEGTPSFIEIGDMIYDIEQQDCFTLTLFENNEQFGELQELMSGNEIGSLEFMIFFNPDSSLEKVECPACYTSPPPMECDINEELE